MTEELKTIVDEIRALLEVNRELVNSLEKELLDKETMSGYEIVKYLNLMVLFALII